MIKRNFIQPTNDEIREREKMYEEADSLGIDLMGYDSDHSSMRRQDRRKAVVLLGTGKPVPKELKDRLTKGALGENRGKVK